jgi:hypothetical protein
VTVGATFHQEIAMLWADRYHLKHPKERLIDGISIALPLEEACGAPGRGHTELPSRGKIPNPPGQSQAMDVGLNGESLKDGRT